MITLPRLGAIGAALLAGSALVLTAAPVHADGGATRTWVSGVGDDANPCSRTAPCKTFAAAIAVTAPGGEIDALDPGGFGAVTITKSITIDGGGYVAGVLSPGQDGIVIQAGAGDNVVLRNLGLDGGSISAGCTLSGVKVLSAGSVQLEHVSIADYDRGVALPLTDSAPGASVDTTLDDVSVTNTHCAGIDATPDTGRLARVALSDSVVAHTGTGYAAGPGSESWLSGTSVVFNGTGLSNTGGVLHDACGNVVAGNGANGAFSDHAATCATGTTQPGTTTSTGGAATSATAYCVVPKLKGRTKAAAAKTLTAAHCTVGKATRKKGKKAKRGKVLTQGIPAGTSVKPGTAVTIVLGR